MAKSKKSKSTSKRKAPAAKRRDWVAIVERCKKSAGGVVKITMGSAGSAQVTRVRLIDEHAGIAVSTKGDVLTP